MFLNFSRSTEQQIEYLKRLADERCAKGANNIIEFLAQWGHTDDIYFATLTRKLVKDYKKADVKDMDGLNAFINKFEAPPS